MGTIGIAASAAALKQAGKPAIAHPFRDFLALLAIQLRLAPAETDKSRFDVIRDRGNLSARCGGRVPR
jgi:hypothetical protein